MLPNLHGLRARQTPLHGKKREIFQAKNALKSMG